MLALRIKKAVRNGATLVVADPRKIWLTKLAKRHLQLRPGTDVWLLNAMMNVIVTEGLVDEEYVRDKTEGFDAVKEVVLRYTPEEAEKVTGVPAEAIRATAREYATERHAAIFYTLGITEHASGVDNIWSLANLVLMTGHLGYESTGLNALRGQNNVQGLNDAGANPSYLPGYQSADDPEVRRKFSEAWGVEVPAAHGYRLDQIISGLHDGRVKALYLIGENPAQTEPNAHHVEDGLAGVEFLVSQDIFLNDSSRQYADVVLPASSFAEKDGTFTNTERRVNRVRKALDCPGEAREDWRIVCDLAKALGADWPDYREPGGRVERVRRPRSELVRDPLRPDRGAGAPVALHRPRRSGDAVPARAGAGARRRARALLPGRVPAADRAARCRVPARPLHGPDALPLQLGDDDDARAGGGREAGAAVLRDLAGGCARARARRRRPRPARLAARRAGGPCALLRPGLPGARLDGAPLRAGEGELADARRRGSADRNAGVQGVGGAGRSGGVKLGEPRIHVESCESTQALIEPSMPEGALALADFQTAGRGRLGRTWEAPAGTAILSSILLKPPPERKAPELSLVAGVAVADALEELLDLSVQIKWPNDVMLRREKVCGILAEARDGAVVLGVGVNVNQVRDELPPGAGSLRTATGREWDREAVLDAVLDALGRRYEQWLAGGLDAVYEGLGPRDFLRGRRVTVNGKSGTATRIDREGRLEIATGHGEARDGRERRGRLRALKAADQKGRVQPRDVSNPVSGTGSAPKVWQLVHRAPRRFLTGERQRDLDLVDPRAVGGGALEDDQLAEAVRCLERDRDVVRPALPAPRRRRHEMLREHLPRRVEQLVLERRLERVRRAPEPQRRRRPSRRAAAPRPGSPA